MMRARWFVLALLVWGVVSFGAVYPWGYWPLAVGCGAVGLWGIIVTKAWRDPRPRLLAWSLAAVAVAIALQLVPLPLAWFRQVTPAADQLLAQLQLAYAVQPPPFHAVSVTPKGTLTALALFVLFGLFLVGMMRVVARLSLEWLVGQFIAFGLALALFGIVQKAVIGSENILVYGFWKPTSGIATPFGPFINRNHFAGWMVMVLPLVAAYATALAQAARGPFMGDWRSWTRWLITPDASRFVFVSVSMLVMAVALVLTGSRSGLGSFVVAMSVLGALSVAKGAGRTRRLLPAVYLAALVIAAVGWAGVGRTAARFERAAAELNERASAWRDTVHIIQDFPLTGTGLGGFGEAMLVYQTADRSSIYVQAHNDYLQVLAEGGLLVSVPAAIALAVLCWTIFLRYRRREDAGATYWLRSGAVAGLIGIGVQSLLDFSLQMPGNAVMFTVLCAIAMHRPSAGHHAHRV
jgi:putative inorganic carbon (HCO3(-)) transporter